MKPGANKPGSPDPDQSSFDFQETAFTLVAVVASAGGLHALMHILAMIPADFPAAIVIVQHLDPRRPSMMAPIISRRTTLAVKQAENNELIKAGSVYIAPPDRHLLVNRDGTLSLSQTELVHFVRPSGDLLLESAAAALNNRVIALILTGTGVDGTTGAQAIKKMGGVVIVQDEATSDFFGMPGSAIRTGIVDYVLPLDQIAPSLVKLVLTGEIS